MAKQKRLNKGLVAFITLAGMLVIVSVAVLVIQQTTRHDPEVLARNARELEDTGETDKLEKAARMFGRAYALSGEKDTRYLLDVARVAYKLGEIGDWLGTLKRVNARTPTDPAPLVAILEGLWRLRDIAGYGTSWTEWRDSGSALLRLDATAPLPPDQQVLAAASRVWGLWSAGDGALGGEIRESPEIQEKWGRTGDEAAQKLYELAPRHPLAAITYVDFLRRQVQAEYNQAQSRGASDADLQRIVRDYTPRALDILRAAIAEHPGHVGLLTAFSNLARNEYVALIGEGKTESAEALLDEVLAATDAALASQPNTAELHFARGRALGDRLGRLYRDDQLDAARPVKEAVLAACLRVTEIDPAYYQAYSLQADAIVLPDDPNSDTPEIRAERLGKALRLYEDARDRTLTLRTLRALLTAVDRQLMLYRGFIAALQNVEMQAPGESEARKTALARAKAFLDDAQTRMPQFPLTAFMEGEYLRLAGEPIGAIKAYERAHESAKVLPELLSGSLSEGRFWLQQLRTVGLPTERLAVLYQAGGEVGEALRYGQLTMQQYVAEVGMPAPPYITLLVADALVTVNRARDALEVLDRYRDELGRDRQYATVRARALSALGRKDEAAKLTQAMAAEVGEGVEARLWQARTAMDRQDYDAVREAARPIVTDPTATDSQVQAALQLIVNAADAANERESARAYVEELLASSPRESLVRSLRAYQIILSETDADKRDAALLELIREVADPVQRLERTVAFFASRDRPAEALEACLELRKRQPDELRWRAAEFGLRLELKQFDDAAALMPALTQAEGGAGLDRAGGATFRARLAMAKGDPEAAVREYRQAMRALPTSGELLTGLGQALVMSGRTTEAIDALERAIASNPRSIQAHGLLVDAYDELAGRVGSAERQVLIDKANEVFESLARLAPRNTFVLARRERMEEAANPREAIARREAARAKRPDDVTNLTRLAELYREAWTAADTNRDERSKAELVAAGNAFFEDAVPKLEGPNQFLLVRLAANFFATTEQRDAGVEFLRRFGETADAGTKILNQVLIARLLEATRDAAEAERAYQEAQVLVRGYQGETPERTQQVQVRVGLELIDFYQRAGRAQEVVAACNWFINMLGENHPDTPEVRLRLVDALVSNRQFDDARREIDTYFAKHGATVSGLAARARLNLMARHTRDLAESDLTAILQQDPQNAWAMLTRGWLAMQRARYSDAREDLTNARTLITPQSPLASRLYVLLSQYYRATQQPDLAIQSLREHLAAMSRIGARGEQVEQVVVELVQLLRENNRFDDARRLISEYMERDPDSPRWPELLAASLKARADEANRKGDTESAKRDYIAAASYFDRAAERYGEKDLLGLSSSLAARMDCLTRAGQPRDALEVFARFPISKIATRPPEIPAVSWPIINARIRTTIGPPVARAYWALDDKEQSRNQWRQALADAANAHASLVRAVTEELLYSLPPLEVQQILASVAQQVPVDMQSGQLLRIELAEQIQRMSSHPDADRQALRSKALAILDEVDQAAGTNSIVLTLLMLERAKILDSQDDEKGAVAQYEKVLQLDGNNRIALNNLAFMYTKAKDPSLRKPEAAMKLAERLETLIEDDGSAASMFDTIGWVYFQYALTSKDRRGYLARAEEMIRQSISLRPNRNSEAYEHLAQVYMEMSRTAEARSTLERGLAAARADGDEPGQARLNDLMSKVQ